MDPAIRTLVEAIHASPRLAVIAVTGAGGQALAWILGVPGASRTVLEALVPYGAKSMAQFLGHEPSQSVSPETAREMARAAYAKALDLRQRQEPVVGVACTATIATDRPKRGQHRCCIATWDDTGAPTTAWCWPRATETVPVKRKWSAGLCCVHWPRPAGSSSTYP